jgi:hypothetical protein
MPRPRERNLDYFPLQELTQQSTAHQGGLTERAPVPGEVDSPRRHDHSSPRTPLTARLVVNTPQTAILGTCSRETQGQSHSPEPPSDSTRTVPSGAVSSMGAGHVISGCHSAQSNHPWTPPSCLKTGDLQTQLSPFTIDGSPDCKFSESNLYPPRRLLKAIRHGLGLFKKTQAHPTAIAERNIVSVLLRGRAGLIVEEWDLECQVWNVPTHPF